MAKKPTIYELEAILDEEEDSPIEILPNGEVRGTRRKRCRGKRLSQTDHDERGPRRRIQH